MYYYVLVEWLEWDSKTKDYIQRQKKFSRLWAKDTTEASQKALAMSPDGICKSVSMLWHQWPQPTSGAPQ